MQLALFPCYDAPPKAGHTKSRPDQVFQPGYVPDLATYHRILVMYSGGKDSTAAFLAVWQQLEARGIDPRTVMEIWHHEIDGREGSSLMDWPVTPAYCRAFAEAFGVPIFFQWKVGGFEGEMLRDNQPTAPTRFELPDGTLGEIGGRGPNGTRLKFPQVSANLSTRWCSAYLKIDVAAAALRNDLRFQSSRTLVVTGERAEESPGRSHYATFEAHKADPRSQRKPPARNGRWVDHWRPVHHYQEAAVWELMQSFDVNPHPVYKLGWGRVSCRFCIFGNDNQWASAAVVDPDGMALLMELEERFGFTIHRDHPLAVRIRRGMAYDGITRELVEQAMSRDYSQPVILPAEAWELPAGAFGESDGPT